MTYEEYYYQHKVELDQKAREIREQASIIPNEKNRDAYIEREMRATRNAFIRSYNG